MKPSFNLVSGNKLYFRVGFCLDIHLNQDLDCTWSSCACVKWRLLPTSLQPAPKRRLTRRMSSSSRRRRDRWHPRMWSFSDSLNSGLCWWSISCRTLDTWTNLPRNLSHRLLEKIRKSTLRSVLLPIIFQNCKTKRSASLVIIQFPDFRESS